MKRLRMAITMLAMWLWVASPAQSVDGVGIRFLDNSPWQEVLTAAQQENKLIFIDCYTSWCGPCKALAKEVFTRPEVGAFFNDRFINVKYDMEKGDGKMLRERYRQHIIGFPTLLLVNAEGKVLQQLAGYQQPEALIGGIRKAAEGRDLFTLTREYGQGNREIGFIKEYIESLNRAFLRDSAAHVAHDFIIRMQPADLDKDSVWQTVGSYVTDVRSDAFAYLVDNANRYQHKLHRDRLAINRQVGYACERELRSCLNVRPKRGDDGTVLCADTIWMQRLIHYMEKVNVEGRDRYQSKLYIHKLLLKGLYDEAWQVLMLCCRMQLSGYYSTTVHDYVCYLMEVNKDKRALKAYLAQLEAMQGDKREYNYHTLETMARLCQRLGLQKRAEVLMREFKQIDEEKRKEIESFLKREK